MNKEYLDFMKEQMNLERDLKIEISKAIDKVRAKYGIEGVALVVDLVWLDSDFKISSRKNLIDETDHGFCDFCGAKTYYYKKMSFIRDKDALDYEGYICAGCFSKLNKR